MNREVVARASRPCVGRTNRTGETPVPLFRRNGSWSQCMRKSERGLSMNRRFGPPEGGTPNKFRPTIRFKVPMHGIKVVGALHERQLDWTR
jgi:hypothetical protein